MTFFYDMNKKLAELAKAPEQLNEGAQPAVAEGSTGDYSAKKARAGKDIGRPGKAFAKIARGAAERYGSKERGEKVAGAVLVKLRKGVGEAAKPDFLDLDKDGNKTEPMRQAARQAKGVKEAGAGRDMTRDLVKGIEKATGGKETAKRDAKGVLQLVKKKTADKRKGPVDEVKLADLPVRQVKGRAYGAQPEEFDQDDEDQDATPKKLGRKAVGAGKGKKIGMKIPGKSKLLQKGAIREDDIDIQDQGEYGMEGDAAKDDIHTLVRDARALEKILGDSEDLPEWVQAKLTKAKGMISAVSDYMQTQHERAGEQGMEVELDEKAVSVAQRRAAGIAHAAQKGEIPKSKLRGASKEMAKMSKKELHKFAATKEKDLPQKKGKEEVEETTTSGSVATAPASAPKKSKGMQFGKGIYDSMNRDLEAMIAESMSINISTSTEGSPSVSVSATDDDAAKLAQMLRAAGIGTGMEQQGQHACPTCGQEPCGCAEQVDENQPDWPTNTETSDDALQYSGGLNKPKTTVAGDGQTTVPVTAVQVREAPASNLDQIIDRYPQAVADFKQSGAMDSGLRDALYDYYFQRGDIRGDDDPHEFLAQKLQDVLGVDESQHMAEAKCMECGMYEGSCECDKDMDESIQRMRDLAGIKEAKPDFLDIKKKAAQNKEKQDDEKVEESILNMRRLWQEYKG